MARTVVATHGIDALVKVVHNCSRQNSRHAAYRALGTIARLAPEMCEAIAKAGGVDSIIGGMRATIESVASQESSAACIAILVDGNSALGAAIVDKGGIDALVLAMGLYPFEAALQRQCALALSRIMACSAELRRAVNEARVSDAREELTVHELA